MHLEPFPDLPLDLERLILECSAVDDRAMALKLVGVSLKVQAWIDPILYKSVKLDYPTQAKAFVHTLGSSRKHCSFFTNNVKLLSFAYGIDLKDIVTILSACGGVTNLASSLELSHLSTADYTSSDFVSFSNLLTPGSLSLRRLSIILHDCSCTSGPDFTNLVLRQVTHLDMYQGSDYFKSWSWQGFHQLSQLTHLSFDLSVSASLEVVVELLPHFPPNLRMCLVLLSTRDSSTSIEQFCTGNEELYKIAAGDVDWRLVVGTNEPLTEEYRGPVLVHLHPTVAKDDEEDIWYKAEQILAERKQKRRL